MKYLPKTRYDNASSLWHYRSVAFSRFSSILLRFSLLFALLFSITVRAEQASPVLIDNASRIIGNHLVVLDEALITEQLMPEKSHQPLTLEQAQQAYEQDQFIHLGKTVLSFGIGVSPRWLVAEIENPLQDTMLRRLIIENSWLDKIDIYLLHNGKLVKQLQLGDSFPFTERVIKHRFFAFDHDYAPGVSRIFIRVETPDPLLLPIYFGSLGDSAQRDMFNGYSYGLLYGVVTALLLYNFILFLQLRLKRYLFYVIYLATFVLTNQSYTGHAYFLFWQQSPFLQQWMIPFFITLYALSGIVFTFLFLKSRTLFPRVFFMTLFACLAVLLLQGVFFIQKAQSLAVILSISLVVFFAVFSWLLTIFSLKKSPKEVWYFLVATIATLTGSIITAMTVFGVLPYYEITYRAVEIGISIDVILLSIALAEQFRLLRHEKQLAQQLANLDPLTGLFNRRAFYERAKLSLYNARRYNKNLSGILFDIDHFKKINDQYGHSIGDEVIKKAAEIVQAMIRKGDVSARWGGEEFVILLPENRLSETILLAERLRESIEKLVVSTTKGQISFTISLGVAQLSQEMNSIDELIRLADMRMYQAKQSGRNQICTQ